MTKSYGSCVEDNKNRENPVPEDVIQRQMYTFKIPFYEEGFDKIVVHKIGKAPVDTSFFIDIATRMKKFNKKTRRRSYFLRKRHGKQGK